MTENFDILAVGDYCVDLIFTGMPSFPELGKEVFATDFNRIPGGAYNTVVAANRLGLKIGWACDFGDDECSEFVLQKIREEGLIEDLFIHHKKPLRRITASASFPEERAFLTYYQPGPKIPAGFKALTRFSAKILYVPGFFYGSLFDLALPLVKTKKMQIIMDGNSSEPVTLKDPSVKRAINSLSVFLPNLKEACQLTGENDVESSLRILGEVCPTVVVKAGKEGAFGFKDGKLFHIEAIPVKPIDTTGAGDCFNAGFLKAWVNDLPFVDCMKWGNIVGGLSTTGRGATSTQFSIQDVQKWLDFYNQKG
jgi:sugar/nucleoside kinase (ribokinase family)